MALEPAIPTVDLSPFFHEGEDEDGKRRATEMIDHASRHYGFFQIVNHGVPPSLMARVIELSQTFFQYPMSQKLKWKSNPGAHLPAGYNIHPEHSRDKSEYLFMFVPSAASEKADLNVIPDDPPELRGVLEEICCHLSKTASLVEDIFNECLGLPENFLKEYNKDRSSDIIAPLHYWAAKEGDDLNGLSEHEDANCISFIFQDDAGGLEVKKDGEWISLTPTAGNIVVNVGDVIQVLSNGRFKSATHRVVRKVGKSRYACGFFHSLNGDTWVEPLPHFTKEIGEKPKYRGFWYKDYQTLRLKNKSSPPSDPKDIVHLSYYAIPS